MLRFLPYVLYIDTSSENMYNKDNRLTIHIKCKHLKRSIEKIEVLVVISKKGKQGEIRDVYQNLGITKNVWGVDLTPAKMIFWWI